MRHQVHSFVTLDGLRGVAALAVVMFHGDPYFVPFAVSQGYLAVDFFFALSGFVLAYAYTQRLRQDMSTLTFFQLRVVRLYPLYILGTAFGLLSLLPHPPDWAFSEFPINLVAAVLFLPSPGSIIFFPFNHPLWSLFHELVANLAFAALSRRLSGALLCGIVTISAVLLIEEARWWGTLDSSNGWENWGGGFIRVSFSFFAGILLYRIWQKRPAPVNLPAPILGLCLLAVLSFPVPNAHEAVYDTCVVLVRISIAPLVRSIEQTKPPSRQSMLVDGEHFLRDVCASLADDPDSGRTAYAGGTAMGCAFARRGRFGGRCCYAIFRSARAPFAYGLAGPRCSG